MIHVDSTQGEEKMRELERKNIPWDVNALVKKLQNGTAVVDSTSQRGLVWNTNLKKKLITSLIYNINIGTITCNRKGDIFSIIDGQQRGDALRMLLEDKLIFDLPEPIKLENGEEITIQGKRFSDLPQNLQTRIKKRSLVIYYYENLNYEEEAFVIDQLNSGKPMTSVEKAMIGAKSYPVFKEMRTHELFQVALSDTAMNGSVYAEIIVKAWMLLFSDNISFDKNVFEPTMKNVVIDDNEKKIILGVFDRIVDTYQILMDRCNKDESTDRDSLEEMSKEELKAEKEKAKEAKKQRKLERKKIKVSATLMLKKLHLLSIIPLVNETIKQDVPVEKLADWILYFFVGEKEQTSISSLYNENIKRGTGHPATIQARLEAVKDSWQSFEM